MALELHHTIPFGEGTLRICDRSQYGKTPEKKQKPANKKVLLRTRNGKFYWSKNRQ